MNAMQIAQESLISNHPYSPFKSSIHYPQEESLNLDEPFFRKREY